METRTVINKIQECGKTVCNESIYNKFSSSIYDCDEFVFEKPLRYNISYNHSDHLINRKHQKHFYVLLTGATLEAIFSVANRETLLIYAKNLKFCVLR